MPKKTLITAFLFLAVYAYLVQRAVPNGFNAVQSQWARNIVHAQDYIYGDLVPNKVIVGTSLSSRIVMDSLDRVYNFSFDGQSVLDGLQLLLLKNTVPKEIYIEVNLLFRPEGKDFIKAVSNPIFFDARKQIHALRDENQPVGVLGSYAGYYAGDWISNLFKKSELSVDNSLMENLLDLQSKNYMELPESNLVIDNVSSLKRSVKLLEKRGSKIYFFEMPVNSRLMKLPRARMVRDVIITSFDPTGYRFIAAPNADFITTDGVHLSQEEASIFTQYFKQQLTY
jgi:hypothetical protein